MELTGDRLALVVATGTYADAGLSRLRAQARDAADLAQVLADPGIGGFTVTTVIDQPAQQIRLAVEDFLDGRGTGDLLLVYLSCHGLLDNYRRLYFAAADTRKDRLGSTGVEAAWVLDQLEHCRARRQILILDSCFSGAFARGAKGEADLGLRDRFLGQGRGRVVLTASTATEYSFEGEPADTAAPAGSVFTAALVQGLRTGAADLDRDGHVSVDDAYGYVFDQVQAAGAAQTPQRWLYGAEGQILLARSPAGPAAIAPPSPASPPSPPSPPGPALPSRLARTLTGHTKTISDMAYSPDGLLLATAGHDGTARLWHPATGRCLHTLTGHDIVIHGVRDTGVHGVAFSPDGRLLATGGDDGTARLWDPATGRCLRTLTGHTETDWGLAFGKKTLFTAITGNEDVRILTGPGVVMGVAFSPDGRLLATASRDKTARLWDPATGDCLRTLTGHTSTIAEVTFSPDGRLLATASRDETARLWDPATGECLRTLDHDNELLGVAFSPDGRLLATVGTYGTALLWDPAAGRRQRTLTVHGTIWRAAFSPDGRLLAAASQLWDPATGNCLHDLPFEARSMAFSPDGHLLATASDDGKVRLLEMSRPRSF